MVLIEIVHEIIQAVSHYIFSTTEKNIRNEIVLITGSGRGLGQQIAVLFAKRGAIVVLCDTTEIGNSQTVELISPISHEQRVYSYTCDIGNRDEVDQLVKKIQSEVGDISILVNNGLFRIIYFHIQSSMIYCSCCFYIEFDFGHVRRRISTLFKCESIFCLLGMLKTMILIL